MKARLPQGFQNQGGMNNMLRQAQKMQQDAAALQEELETREYSAAAGGGMIEVVMDGKHRLQSVKIKPEAIDPDDVEMLEDLIRAAVNEAARIVDDTAAAEMEKITGGLDLPGLGL